MQDNKFTVKTTTDETQNNTLTYARCWRHQNLQSNFMPTFDSLNFGSKGSRQFYFFRLATAIPKNPIFFIAMIFL